MADGAEVSALPGVPPSRLGESPVWLAERGGELWWCDIPGCALHCWSAAGGAHRSWPLPCEPGCIAPLPGGRWLIAMRDGLWRFDPADGRREPLAPPPYDPAHERFNDGKCDPLGRFWVSTIWEPRDAPRAALYRWAGGSIERLADGVTVGNGLAFSPDARRMLWADTAAHRIDAFDLDLDAGTLSRRRPFAAFAPKAAGQGLTGYGGRPDGAAVDAEGCTWVAMFEGARLVRLAPDGTRLDDVPLPVRCPTMPCFGGPDLRTLYVTTARDKRPADELAREPLAGCVLVLRTAVPGLPVHYARP